MIRKCDNCGNPYLNNGLDEALAKIGWLEINQKALRDSLEVCAGIFEDDGRFNTADAIKVVLKQTEVMK